MSVCVCFFAGNEYNTKKKITTGSLQIIIFMKNEKLHRLFSSFCSHTRTVCNQLSKKKNSLVVFCFKNLTFVVHLILFSSTTNKFERKIKCLHEVCENSLIEKKRTFKCFRHTQKTEPMDTSIMQRRKEKENEWEVPKFWWLAGDAHFNRQKKENVLKRASKPLKNIIFMRWCCTRSEI